jgi:hypothetical protein
LPAWNWSVTGKSLAQRETVHFAGVKGKS